MPSLTCNSCNKEFEDENEQKLHYKSEWHRYNLKRKVAGVPGVTEALFLARQTALAVEKSNVNETPTLYSCGLCGKDYRSAKAHAQHIKSKSHILRASQGTSNDGDTNPIVKHLAPRVVQGNTQDIEESEDSDWEEVDPEDYPLTGATDEENEMDVDADDDRRIKEFDPSCCFMCDLQHDTIESCIVHLHKQHGFFIPDVEYLKDPKGLLTYLGLKVTEDFLCLYCSYKCHPFSDKYAVRKHMAAKGHCKVHYGDGDDEEEAELEEFYDYSSSYTDADGKQLAVVDDSQNRIELGTGGSELILTRRTEEGGSSKRVLGSREFLRYYRQKPRPVPANDSSLSAALASRYKSMGLTTVQSREHMVRLKVIRAMNKSGVENMRSKIGMKSNVIRNLPKNVPY